jgi:HlyB family type I secretion system ABC transporter
MTTDTRDGSEASGDGHGVNPSLARHLLELPRFCTLSGEDARGIAALAESASFAASAAIFEQGTPAEGLYTVLAGEVHLSIAGPAGPVHIDKLREGALFGIAALESAVPMAQSAHAGPEGAFLQVIPRDRLRGLLAASPELAARIHEGQRVSEAVVFLAACASFRDVPRDALAELAGRAAERSLARGERLIAQGEQDDHLFIVKSGHLVVTRREAPSNRIAQLGSGDVVGEMAVLTREARSADVVADTEAQVITVPGEEFRRVAGANADLARRVGALVESRRQAAVAGATASDASEVAARGAAPGAASQTPAATPPTTAKDQAPAGPRTTSPQQPAKVRAAPAEAPLWGGRWPWLAAVWSRFSAWRKRRAKPPAVLQHSEMDCSAACLSTICRFYGKEVSINTTRELARVRQEGASLSNIVRALREMGFKAEAYESSLAQLKQKRLPAIANWRGYHWVVVHEVTDTTVVVADPAEGLVTYTTEKWMEGWARFTIFVEPTPKFDEFPETPATVTAFLPFFTPYKRQIADIFLASFLLMMVGILAPLFTKFIIDDIILKGSDQWLLAAVVVMIAVLLLEQMLTFVRNEIVLKVTSRCNSQIIGSIYERLLSLPLSYFSARKTGDITSRLEQNDEITQFVTQDGLETFLSLFSMFAYLGVMIYFNAWLALAAVSVLLLNILLVAKISPRLRQIDRETFVKEADQESHLIESLRGAATLKMIGADHLARWQFENHFAAVANMHFKEAKLAQLMELAADTLDSLSDIMVLLLGGAFVIMGELTIGELVAFIAFANALQDPINDVIGKWDEFQEVIVAVERLNDIMEKEPEFKADGDADRIVVPRLRGHVEFRSTTFRYSQDDDTNVVQNINLSLPPGTKVALVGASGSGKSSLIKLLYGFYKPSSGQVLIDGFDVTEVSLQGLRSQIAMVPQKSAIYRGSVRENIALARPGATLEQVRDAAMAAGAHDFISLMPGAYEALLEEGGVNLSGGQRQRLAIARAFLQDGSILVLDEATSALDNETERIVMDNIALRYAGRTVIMIAHRLSTVRNADLLVVLDRGVVVESGTHDDLLAARGVYYHLCARQLEQD